MKNKVWWYTPIISALEGLRQDCKFKTTLGNTATPCLKKRSWDVAQCRAHTVLRPWIAPPTLKTKKKLVQ
jgi:hypothetical protein